MSMQTGPVETTNKLIKIGCSGYLYRHWRSLFYPPELPSSRWLQFYSQHFATLELNNTFYNLPTATTFDHWRDTTPADFIFSVKASRFLTHMKKLKEPQEALAQLFERAGHLGPKLGPVLYQLPPRWRFNLERLTTFLEALPKGYRHTIEVRDQSWLIPQFFAALEKYGVAYCISSLPLYKTPVVATAPFVYFRFHGSGQIYDYCYTQEEIKYWSTEVQQFAEQGYPVYVYFDNDPHAYAIRNAFELIANIG
ncbi:MAG TPA: DUF72 domain-containing protein [Chloroflexia bacterium]|nr:DUF72 domain-containing protein [Chloroflexia bacterium]